MKNAYASRLSVIVALVCLAACSARGGGGGPMVDLDAASDPDAPGMDSPSNPDVPSPTDTPKNPIDRAQPPEDLGPPPVDIGPPVDRPVSPSCGDRRCDAAAGETCMTCASDCGRCPPVCGDSRCERELDETCTNCPGDCGPCSPTCGDSVCAAGETCTSCPGDCGPCDPGCSALTDCASCRANTRCGFCTNTGACAAGNLSGPMSPVTGCTLGAGTWIAGAGASCPSPDACATNTDCTGCARNLGCGWCANSNQCVAGSTSGPTSPMTGCTATSGTWVRSTVSCSMSTVNLTTACTSAISSGSSRDCSWRREGVHTCTAGVTVRVGCATGAGCGLGSCTGDAVLRVCAGSVMGCSAPGLLTADDTCGACPYGTFTCPSGGQYTVFTAPYTVGGTASCTVGTSP